MQNRILFLLLFLSFNLFANKGPGEIYVNLQKLYSHKRVLYVAAHPDDENTRALAWFSLGEKAETAYFSLTRGDGGQNLIGDELGEKLGVLRTQELLAARSYDGAKQFFSRAVDFGYSKSADESLDKWGEEALLEDLVLMIRKFQPDVIVTRFPPDERAGHGHHTASALLAIEAFSKAADPNYLPEQAKELGSWETTSIYWNTSYWWDDNIKDLADGDPNYLITDIGGYSPLLGMSFNEIGTVARSQHKCQGFGAVVERGSRVEYFKHLEGKKLTSSFFENNTKSWSQLVSPKLEKNFEYLLDNFDFNTTENNVPILIKILNDLKTLEPTFVNQEKVNRCVQLIQDCMGLRVELSAEDYSFVAGSPVNLKLSVLNRSTLDVLVGAIELPDGSFLEFDTSLIDNEWYENEFRFKNDLPISTPYWLRSPFGDVFQIKEQSNRLKAENDATIRLELQVVIDGKEVRIPVAATYKWRDPAYGEREREIIAVPRFSANFEQDIVLLKSGSEKILRIRVHSFQDSLVDTLKWESNEEWYFKQKEIPIYIEKKHGELWFDLVVSSSDENEGNGAIRLLDSKGNQLYQYQEIVYDHIPNQVIFSESSISCKLLNAEIVKGKIAYITGVKDAVPVGIQELGFDLDVFEVADLSNLDLSGYQSIVLGIRVYNVYPELANYNAKLYEYVENGGNLIMQYNTASRSISDQEFGPKPFQLSRNRVTQEEAEAKILVPDHPVFNSPNKITPEDFDGWVQERGLYFAGEWDSSYTPLISWSDDGEEPVEGALIVLKHGEGQFIYTGISFFRELPKGVVGAYRLFANLLSY